MTACVIDISALLTYLQGEPGEDVAGGWLDRGAATSALTVQELVSKIARDGGTAEDAVGIAAGLGLVVHPLTEPLAVEAGAMIAVTRPVGLSQGDRACLALARALGLPAVTADRPWTEVAGLLGVGVTRRVGPPWPGQTCRAVPYPKVARPEVRSAKHRPICLRNRSHAPEGSP